MMSCFRNALTLSRDDVKTLVRDNIGLSVLGHAIRSGASYYHDTGSARFILVKEGRLIKVTAWKSRWHWVHSKYCFEVNELI